MSRSLRVLAAGLLIVTSTFPGGAAGQAKDGPNRASTPASGVPPPTPASDEASERVAGKALRDHWSSKALTEMSTDRASQFAREMSALSRENVFGKLWGREGLTSCERSLVTLSILIALRAQDEMRVHFPSAMQNGCSVKQLEEIIYQSTGYAGFPAANLARRTAIETLREEGLIEK